MRRRGNSGDAAIGDRWCILRTTGGRTIALARSLVAAGIEAWTPVKTIDVREGRTRRRGQKDVPIAPTFVFVRGHHLPELVAIGRLFVSPHPGFSIFRYSGRTPLVSDAEIKGLRMEEERGWVRALRKERHAFAIGQRLQMPEGAFTGMTGIVESSDGKLVMVNLGGNFSVKVEAWLMREQALLVA